MKQLIILLLLRGPYVDDATRKGYLEEVKKVLAD